MLALRNSPGRLDTGSFAGGDGAVALSKSRGEDLQSHDGEIEIGTASSLAQTETHTRDAETMLPPRLSSRRLAGTALAALCGLASGSGGAPPHSSSHGVLYARPDTDGDAAGTGRPPLKGSSPPLLARALQRQDKGNKNKEKDKGGEKAAPPPAPPAAAAGGDALHGTPATADCLRQ
ncbi:hypothetical protein THAOC_22687, partial [Thalassiosira oceanica]